MNKTLSPAGIYGHIDIPGSKSHTIRALLIALFSNSKCVLHNALISDDTTSCIKLCKSLGANITYTTNKNGKTSLFVDATNLVKNKTLQLIAHYNEKDSTKENAIDNVITIDCGNSGTTLYLATAMCCALGLNVKFTGDEQLQKRPIEPLLNSLRDLGATTIPQDAKALPFCIKGPLKGGRTSIECPTSQYLSALLLACPMAQKDSVIDVPVLFEKPYIEMTKYWLKKQIIQLEHNSTFSHFTVKGNQHYKSFEEDIGGDYSSASAFFCAAAITGGTITVSGLCKDDPQGDKAVLDVLEKMGCIVQWQDNKVTVKGPKRLKCGKFDINDIPDALPVLAIAGCFANGPIKLFNVAQARLKETDRIHVMAHNINALGGKAIELDDGLEIFPIEKFGNLKKKDTLDKLDINSNKADPFVLKPSINGPIYNIDIEEPLIIDSYNDHRIVMAMALASLRCSKNLTILGSDAVSITFPTFFDLLEKVRIRISV